MQLLESIKIFAKIGWPYRRWAPFVFFLIFLQGFLDVFSIVALLPLFQMLILRFGNPPEDAITTSESEIFSLAEIEAIQKYMVDWDNAEYILCAIIVSIFILKFLIIVGSEFFLVRISGKLHIHWSNYFLKTYVKGPYGSFSQDQSGAVANNIIHETNSAAKFCYRSLQYATNLCILMFMVAGMVFIDASLFAVVIIISILFFIVSKVLFFDMAQKIGRKRLKYNQAAHAAIFEAIESIKEIKILGIENHVAKSVNNIFTKSLRNKLFHSVLLSVMKNISEPLLATIGIAFIIASYTLISKQEISNLLPQYGVFLILLYRTIHKVSHTISTHMTLLNILPSASMVSKLDKRIVHEEISDAKQSIFQIGSIIFQNIEFSYNSKKIFHDLSFEIPKGKITCIVGRSGAGKSSLLDLLTKLREPDGGHITCDFGSLLDCNPKELRQKMGYVSQTPGIFRGTLKGNILLGNMDCTDEQLKKIVNIAHVDSIFKDHPDGWDMRVSGERNSTLSEGQKKRLAIARALVKNPEVLILDEATTAIQQSLEENILKMIKKNWPTMTIIMITHRLDSVNIADQVLLLERGRIAMSGNPESVLSAMREAM